MKRSHTFRVGRYAVTAEYEAVRIEHEDAWAISSEDLGRLELRAAIAVLSHAESIKGGELKFARKVMDLRQTDLASMLEVTSGTVSRWENDAEPIPRQAQLSVLLFLERTARFGTPLPLDSCNDNTLSPVRIVAA